MGRKKAQPNCIPDQEYTDLKDTKLSIKARKELSKDPEVQERYSAFRKSTIPGQRIRNFIATKYDINISETSGSIIGTACKIFIGEVVETARELMSKDKKDGQIEPKYYKMAYKIVTEKFRGDLFIDNDFTSLLVQLIYQIRNQILIFFKYNNMSSYQKLKECHQFDEIIEKHLPSYHIDFPHMDTVLNRPPNVPEKVFGSINHPIHLTTTYAQHSPGTPYDKFEYSRCGNPSIDSFEQQIAKAEFGTHALSFSSGCAAMNALFFTLEKGDHILSCDDVYGGTNRMMRKVLDKVGIENTLVDMSDLEVVKQSIKKNTKILWVETPTNPTLKIFDIEELCKIAKEHNIIAAIDNTFASPILQNPLLLGADISMHSCTKYIGGFSDVMGGVMIFKNQELRDKVFFNLMTNGGCLQAFEAFLLQRSIKTLKLRVEQSCYSAAVLADVLQQHKAVQKVFYPGLKDHKGYDIVQKQMRRGGAMISFELKIQSEDQALATTEKFLKNLKFIILAESLGSSKTMVNIPSRMTHMSVPQEERKKLGINDNLVRITLGLENIRDILEDITQALDKLLDNN